MKVCTKCGKEKDIEDFPIVYGRKRKDGTRKKRIHSQCRKCRYNICRNWFDKNPGYGTEKKKEWYEQNKVYSNIFYKRDYKKKNADRVKQWKKEWDKKNYDWVLEYKRLRYPKIKDKVKEWNKKTCIRMRKELKDCYVIYTICRGKGLKASAIREFPELIELQRIIIKTKRLCQESQTSKNLEKA